MNLRSDGHCNKLEFFSGYMDAFERRTEILKLQDKYGDDINFDGEVGTFEYFSRKELIEELNKIMNIGYDTYTGHII